MPATYPLKRSSIACLLSILAIPAHAVEEDLQAWQTLLVTAPIRDGVSVTMEVQNRLFDDMSDYGQLLLRPSIGFRVFEKATFSVGYGYINTDIEGRPVTHEHRYWQQLAFPITGSNSFIQISNRTRLEERTVESADDLGWRLRQQLRATMPLSGSVKAVAWSEGFFNFNDTDWGAVSGFDRWRNFVGLNIPLAEKMSLEPGYLNQYVNRTAEDKMDHTLSVTLSVSY
jgi:hypothetical protein